VLKSIAGLVGSCRGHVRFKGLELLGHDAADRARCGICLVPEGRALFPSLTVRENLRLSTARREDDWAHLLDDALTSFPRLAERQSQAAGTLSGGEQRMLALARAMVSDPVLLLLDEPSLGLAPLVVNEVFEVIEVFRRRGIALLIVEQYVHRALAVADRVYVMRKGVLHEIGPALDLDPESLAASYLNQDGVST
jgi:branched-chain amino acid transport system ATP-binding protein